VRSNTIEARAAKRARMILLMADGESNRTIGELVDLHYNQVGIWRKRYEEFGLAGLEDEERPGRPVVYDHDDVLLLVKLVTEDPPEGATRWTMEALAEAMAEHGVAISASQAWRICKSLDLKPWQVESWMTSHDPDFWAKASDVCGLYLNPPGKAVVLCVDEKPQTQALERAAPVLSLRPGIPEKRSHDYIRHGTTTLFAALEVATGQVTDACYPRHRHEEFLLFLRQVATAYPRRKLHIVADNYGTHNHPDVRAWLAKHPRITLHFTPTPGSWLNMVEIFFSIITRQAIRRGSFTSVKDLIAAIENFIDGWNERCHPFIWTKTAEELLPRCKPGKRTSFTRH